MTETYLLAEVEEPALWGTTNECLVIFFADDVWPATCLTDPNVVSERPAAGHWTLLYFDAQARRAFYTRFEHSAGLGCDSSRALRVDDEARS